MDNNTSQTSKNKHSRNNSVSDYNLNTFIDTLTDAKEKGDFKHIKNIDEQISGMEQFRKGKISYADMRAKCG